MPLVVGGVLAAGSIGLMTIPTDAARAQAAAAACTAPFDLVRLVHPLKMTADKLAAGRKLTIVAIGSSSTAGAGASSPASSYPSRLAAELKARFPGHDITVLNRGVNGEEVHDMVDRFDADVLAEKPDLVLWQVGTNAVLRDSPLATASLTIRDGVRRLKASGADVVLIDPQFVPDVIVKSEADAMVGLISAAAKEANVDLFQRYAVMRHWHQRDDIAFTTFVSSDDLHMNDWGYACWAKLLGSAIADAANRAAVQSVATRQRISVAPTVTP
jgi:lysophospholipase L1-like esterase